MSFPTVANRVFQPGHSELAPAPSLCSGYFDIRVDCPLVERLVAVWDVEGLKE